MRLGLLLLQQPQSQEFLMKILVMSDSHGSKNNMLEAICKESPDYILHLGDNERDCTSIEAVYPDIPLRKVRGNCDRGYRGLDIDEFVLCDKRFYMTHGHLHSVKTARINIKQAALGKNADILLFGHTHTPHQSVFEGMLIINPGSIGTDGKSYAVLEIENGDVECNIKTL